MNELNDFEKIFYSNNHILKSVKFDKYLKIYDLYFKKFKNKNPVILEIGLYDGGSLELYNKYFEGKCTIYGVDIMKRCEEIPTQLGVNNINITIGNQGSPIFWKRFLKDKPKFDIIIDDGGHKCHQQLTTYEKLYEHMNDDGIYLVEDCHTSYWKQYGGGLNVGTSFIEYTKELIDLLNADHHRKNDKHKNKCNGNTKFARQTNSIHFYDSVVVLEKEKNEKMKVIRNHD
jgi:hypothetical protein